MSDKHHEPKQPPSERKTPPVGTNIVWYLLGLCLLTLFLVSLMDTGTQVELKYMDLVKLIEQGSPTKNPNAAIEIREGEDAKERLVRYSDLDEIKVGPGEITGTVTRRTIDSEAERPIELAWSDLIRLVQEGASAKNPKVGVEINEGSLGKQQKVLYSNLGDLKVGLRDVAGMVTRQVVAPASERGMVRPRDTFHSVRPGLEDNNNALLSLLEKKGFADVKIEPKATFHTARVGVENDNNYLFGLLKDNKFPRVSAEKAQSIWHGFVPMLLLIGLSMAFLLFMMRRIGGAGSAMAFGRSRGKLYAQEDIGVTFADVAGIDEAVDELREVVDFLGSPEKYQVLGGRIPKGVLLVGPPGTGKTLLAKAIAGEAAVPFFSLSGSDFVEMFVGVGAARVRDMFQQAQAKAPCIVFIDELDALGKTRGTSVVGGHDEREQTLNALLVEMDGFTSNSGVIVMAATNRPETLDPALLRPGRFDRHVSVDRPDVKGREQI